MSVTVKKLEAGYYYVYHNDCKYLVKREEFRSEIKRLGGAWGLHEFDTSEDYPWPWAQHIKNFQTMRDALNAIEAI